MSSGTALVLALVLAGLLLAAFSRPVRRGVKGFITTDKKTGKVQITVWPGTTKRRRRR